MTTEIRSLSERTDEELQIMQQIIERAYTHIKIERGLRDTVGRS